MPPPKSGSGGGRNLRPRLTRTNAGVSKTPQGRVGDKANESGDRVEGQESTAGRSQPDQPGDVDVDMGEAPPINESSHSVTDSPAQSNSPSAESTPAQPNSTSTESTPAQSNSTSTESTPAQPNSPSAESTPAQSDSTSTESTPAQSDSTSTESTPASDHEPAGDVDPDDVVLLIRHRSVDHITRQMKDLKIRRKGRPLRKDEVPLAIVNITGGHKWMIFGIGPPGLRRYDMWSWKSSYQLKSYKWTDDEKELEVKSKEWIGTREENDMVVSLRGVAMDGRRDIGLLIPEEGKSWPPPNIRILVRWKKRGKKNVFTSSWEPVWIVEKGWDQNFAPASEPGKALIKSIRNDETILPNDLAVLIEKDITVGKRVLKQGRRISVIQYAVIDTVVRCQQRYDQGLNSKDKKDIAKRHATPAFVSHGNGDSAHVKSGETPFIASKEALDTVIKTEK